MNKHTLYSAIMVICFIYGGMSLLFFLVQTIPLGTDHPFIDRPPFMERINETILPPELNQTSNFTRERLVQFQGRNAAYFLMLIFTSLLGSIISIVAGLAIYSLLRKKEKKELTRSVIDVMTTPEEKLVMKVLEESGGVMTQTELAKRTKLTKVKIHRVIKRLESLKIVDKYSYGMTNKIKLADSVYEPVRKGRNG